MSTEQLGVFQVAGRWKVFRGFDESRSFETRAGAVAYGEDLAEQIRIEGGPVELFVEEFNGELRSVGLAAVRLP